MFTLTAFVDAYGERELPIVHFWRHTGPTLTTMHPLSRAPTPDDPTVSVPSTPAARAHVHRDHTCRKAAQNALHYLRRRRPRTCVGRLNPTFSSQKTPAAKFASRRTNSLLLNGAAALRGGPDPPGAPTPPPCPLGPKFCAENAGGNGLALAPIAEALGRKTCFSVFSLPHYFTQLYSYIMYMFMQYSRYCTK